jgi:hypothetical protein
MPKSLRDLARRFLLVTSTILLLGCQGVMPPAVPPGDGARAPKILRFEAADRSIHVDSQTTLEWATEDADRVEITSQPMNPSAPAHVDAVARSGDRKVGPGSYTLTARNSTTGKKVTAVVKVQGFIPGRPPPPRPPKKKPRTDPRP